MNTINNQQTVDQQDLHDYYQSQIDALNQTIVQQNQYNEEYAKEQEKQFATVIQNPSDNYKDEWSMDEFKDLIGGDFNKVTVISKSPEQTIQLSKHLQGGYSGYIQKGDYWIYQNVFLDSKAGNPISLRFDVVKIQQKSTAGVKETGEYLDALPEIDRIKYSTIFNEEVALLYQDCLLTMKVTFLDANNNPVVLEKPLVIFTDVDDHQGVKIWDMDVKNLKGKMLVERNGIIGNFGTYHNTVPEDRDYWAMYALPTTDHFIYTFYSFASMTTGVYQGVGSETISYRRPDKQYVHWNGSTIQLTDLFVHVSKEDKLEPVKVETTFNQPTAMVTDTDVETPQKQTTSSSVQTGVNEILFGSWSAMILSGLGFLKLEKRIKRKGAVTVRKQPLFYVVIFGKRQSRGTSMHNQWLLVH
ncbi:MAG: hypothetical protein PUG52_08390 [Absicoccus porci]|uniref:hypothetical protein n=1 Tax=Absicoccus porci TaxID=2486576 RepID=UPI0023F2703D|nr:hypothetical protein [Absicoccus porci]MDD7331025.1 hypothetical protein [Absicoccus porci]MDY4737985.1 hypothetical protein [Absicoccus porci]